ncbi:MAG: DUF6470 family protein [Peptococcaceae bacterium]|jgi:hypothetical protein|nr:DUF6470 family protein [Peptococcaceae bacterium]
MITQLLNISTTPVKYELEVERARLEFNQDFIPSYKATNKPSKLQLQSKNAEIKLNTYQARRSLGFNNPGDFKKIYADMGKDSIRKITREYVDIGNDMSRINEGVTIADIYAQKMLSVYVMYQAFIPNTGAEISWEPYQLQMGFTEGELHNEWQVLRDVMNYVPGSVRMTILQQPKVNIEYMGNPMYIPPSADPDYVDPEN